MTMDYLVGIDAGTTGCKTCVFDVDGHLIGSDYREYPCQYPHPIADLQGLGCHFTLAILVDQGRHDGHQPCQVAQARGSAQAHQQLKGSMAGLWLGGLQPSGAAGLVP